MTVDERLVENQRQFRHANERLQEVLSQAGPLDGQVLPFFCECADESCRHRLEATHDQYERAHLHPRQYVIIPGHLTVEGERVVERSQAFDTVRKSEDELPFSEN